MQGPDIRYATGRSNVTTKSIKVLCPFHDDNTPSMAVYADGTKCWVCGKRETPAQYLERVGIGADELPQVDYEEQKKGRGSSKAFTPTSSVLARIDVYHELLMDEDSPCHYKLQWYRDRGIFKHTIVERKLGHTGTRFTLPVWYGEDITGIRYRLDEEFAEPEQLHQYKYLPESGQPVLIYRPAPHQGLPVICEGELDALALSQYGFDAMTTTGGSGTLHLHLTPQRLRLGTVYVAVDNDESGNEAYEHLCEVWGTQLPRLRFEEKDVTEYLLGIDDFDKRTRIEKDMEV